MPPLDFHSYPDHFTVKHSLFTVDFTAVGNPCLLTSRRQYAVDFSDIKYERGMGLIPNEGQFVNSIKLCSISMPQLLFSNKDNTIFYLPGSSYSYDNALKISPVSERHLDLLFSTVSDSGYYLCSGIAFSCKEQTIYKIISTSSLKFRVDIELPDIQRDKLLQLTEKHPIEIKGREVTITSWWLDYYRLGWLLLAFRVLGGRQIIFGQKLFDAFMAFDGDILPDYKKITWSGRYNWNHHYGF